MSFERFGRLDIVANIAGIGDDDLFADDPGAWRRVIDVNLTAVIDSTRSCGSRRPKATYVE